MDKSYDSIVMLCDARVRPALFNLIERVIPRLPVIAYDEIVPGANIQPVDTVSLSENAEVLTQQNAKQTINRQLPIGV